MADIYEVVLSDYVKEYLWKLPKHIVRKLTTWVDSVEKHGHAKTQKVPGYHDEPLKGKRTGQRSIRLNRSYRAIYVMREKGEIEFLFVEEINKHDY
jgi:toxin HigB-1